MKYFHAALILDVINGYYFTRGLDNILQSDFGKKSFDDVDSFLAVSLLINSTAGKLGNLKDR